MVCETCSDLEFITDLNLKQRIENDLNCHDFSKLSHEEFVPYRRYFFPTPDEVGDETINDDLEKAWSTHKERNNHHHENWNSIDKPRNVNEWKVSCVHMVVDWIAMSYTLKDDPKQYYNQNIKPEVDFTPRATQLIESIFMRIK